MILLHLISSNLCPICSWRAELQLSRELQPSKSRLQHLSSSASEGPSCWLVTLSLQNMKHDSGCSNTSSVAGQYSTLSSTHGSRLKRRSSANGMTLSSASRFLAAQPWRSLVLTTGLDHPTALCKEHVKCARFAAHGGTVGEGGRERERVRACTAATHRLRVCCTVTTPMA